MILAAALAAIGVWLAFPTRLCEPHGEVLQLRDLLSRVRAARPGVRRQVIVDRRMWVLSFVAELAAELRAGATLDRSWQRLWASGPPHTYSSLERLGQQPVDVTGVMLVTAEVAGCSGLRQVAACWQVSELTGAGLAPALERVCRSLVADQDLATEIDAQLAGPRASARMLLVLPLFALLLGSSLGVHPVNVLLHNPVGWGCLAAGSVLLLLGWWWSQRQVHAVMEWAGEP